MFDAIDETSLTKLVDVFYTKARNDKDLGEVFNARINSEEKWARHKEMVSKFWCYHLMDNPPKPKHPAPEKPEKKREGGMIGVHKNLSSVLPFPREHFGVWLRLFEESINELFVPSVRGKIIDKAKQMAQTMQEVIYEGLELQGAPHWCPSRRKAQNA